MNNADSDKTESELEKRSVSAPPELFNAAEAMMKRRMIRNFSEYVRSLIREDVNGKLHPAPNENGHGREKAA